MQSTSLQSQIIVSLMFRLVMTQVQGDTRGMAWATSAQGPSALGAPARLPGPHLGSSPAPRAAGSATLASPSPTHRGGAGQCWPVSPGPKAGQHPWPIGSLLPPIKFWIILECHCLVSAHAGMPRMSLAPLNGFEKNTKAYFQNFHDFAVFS